MTFPSTILPIRVGLDLVGDGKYSTDITGDVQQRSDITINRGRPDEGSAAQPSDLSLTLDNRSGNYSLRNPVGAYYGQIGRNTPIKVSVDSATSWLSINTDTGVTPIGGANVSTPDTASLDITGDIDIRFDADLDSWRETEELVTKWTETGNQKSYYLMMAGGFLQFFWSTTGSDSPNTFSSERFPFFSGRAAVRVTLDVDNGAGGSTTTFYTSDTINGTWTQLGDPVITTGTTSIFASTAVLVILDNPNAAGLTSSVRGRVYAAQVRNGIGGTIVANPDFTAQAEGATSFTDSTSKLWTLNGAVSLTKRDVRFVGEVSAWPVDWDTSGRDIYVSLTAAGIMRRLGQGQSPLQSTLRRGIPALTSLRAYWPCEDAVGSTALASALSGSAGKPMLIEGFGATPNLASNSVFPSSSPLPEFNGVKFSGTVAPYTSTGDVQVRFLLSVPSTGAVNGKVLCRIFTTGTAARWDLIYSTGGALSLTAFDDDNNNLGGMGTTAYNVDGMPVRISVELDTSGANTGWRVTTLALGTSTGGTSSGTVSSATTGRCTKVMFNPTLDHMDVAVGHVTVESTITAFFDLLDQLNAYTGESPGIRIKRLCQEQGVEFQGYGNLSSTTLMGPQTPQIFLDLLKECAETDLGLLAESKNQLGISYRPRSSMYNQSATVTVPYTSVNPLGPVEDDALLRNDVTVSRTGGSSYRFTLDTGPMSTLEPPAGAGRYDDAVELNLDTDDQLADQASWRVHMGTVNEARYPGVGLYLGYPAVVPVIPALLGLDLGDRFVITSPPAGRTAPGDVSQILQGMTETLTALEWTMTLKGSPESPMEVGVYSSAHGSTVSRYSSDGTTLAVAVNSSATSWSVATPSGPLWVNDPAEFPFDWTVAGERVTVTAISGTTSPQTATVTRAVNGIVKAQLINTVIELFQPAYYAL